jgi:hypothetical protein
VADIADQPVQYSWNPNDRLFYYREDPRFEKRLAAICNRGVVALSAACAEWVAARWPKLAEPVLLPEVEAVWAGVVDWRFLKPPVTAPNAPQGEAWKTPEAGPVRDAFYSLADVVGRAQRSASTLASCAVLSQLAIHVLPAADMFKEWRRAVVERLTNLYPRDKDSPIGPPIPREALDPQYPYEPALANDLLRKFINQLDPAGNPFLRAPQEMKDLGFEGTPYHLP